MKLISTAKLPLIILLTIMLVNCENEEEGFHQIKGIETLVHNKINEYRASQGINKLVSQYIMFKEASIHSQQIANNLIPADGTNIDERFSNVKSKIGGTNEGYIILSCKYYSADSIANKMISSQENINVIEQNYTQSGVGIVQADNNLVYITHMFLNIP